jgi:HD-GYP domain-containing protein (c-di-GMP phosphodiesterase class II)
MGLSFKEVDDLRDAGLLHDIGKIGIPDAILLKPGRLTEAEFLKIKEHPAIGKKILEPVVSLADKVPLIFHHHERFDGKGYPTGLAGENIPLRARIIAVADAFDAMTSDRPYRTAMAFPEGLAELQRNKNTQFDARVVDAFVSAHKKQKIPN